MIVLDASFLVKLVLEEEGSREARNLAKHWIRQNEILSTLDIALAEALNAIWKHASRIRDLDEAKAVGSMKDLIRIWMLLEVHSSATVAEDAFRLALETGLTVYDSLYIELARSMGAKLATFDTRQAKAAIARGVMTLPG